ncbi:MAG TPA: hypothetical protein VFR34_04165 [Paracoccaceae bacterium]|nr:hypothetical protein [Paracoccaceae bacterium]
MQNAKSRAEAMIRSLPEDATFEDIQYRLYVLEKIDSGLASLEQEGGITHEAAKARLAKWLDD